MPRLVSGASRSQRYAASAALLASGAAVFACGSSETTSNADSAAGAGNNSSAGLGGEAAGGNSGGGADAGGSGSGGTEAGGSSDGGSAGAVTTGRACPGYEETGECRTAADCSSVQGGRPYCSHTPPPGRGCGNPLFEPQCPPGGCGDSMVCVAIGVCDGHRCQPECNEAACTGTNYCVEGVCQPKPCDVDGATPCESTSTCVDGACQPKPCDVDGASSCPDGYICDPAAGDAPRGCLAVSCTEDPDRCDPWQSCEPDRPDIPGANAFGCRIKGCAADGDCGECGYCVNQNCSPTLANCYEEQPAMPYGCVWPDEELV